MTSTRAAAFAGKISNLRETILRIQNGMPQPTCVDLANIIKYFCQVFYDFKDIENISLYAKEKRDQLELTRTLPNFDYSGLYRCLVQLVDILPLIPQPSNGYEQLCTNLISVFKCLVPFLDQANMETMPYLVSTLFMSFPVSMHKCILDTLCFNLLPFTIDQQQRTSAKMWGASVNGRDQQRISTQGERGTSDGVVRDSQKPFHCIVRIEDSSLEANPNDEQRERQQLATGSGRESLGQRRVSSRRRKLASSSMNSDDQIDQGIGLDDSGHYTDGGNSFRDDRMSQDERADEDEYALLSVTSILMVSFHYIQEPMHHSQLIECLMRLKSNVFEDVLYVIAYGTTRARCPAVEILFRYWPDICPSQADRKNNQQSNGKLKHIAWQPNKCQNKSCNFSQLADDDEAVKMCLDYKTSIALSGLPPPMLVCLDCVDSISRQHLNGDQDTTGAAALAQTTTVIGGSESTGTAAAARQQATDSASARHEAQQDCMRAIEDNSSKFLDLLLPMERVSKLCENKKCRSTQDRAAIGTCFDIECANYNGKRPIRYCKACFVSIHEPCEANNYDVTLQNHIRHSSLNLSIMSSEENVNNFVEAIISLLKEAAPADRPSKDSERYLRSLMGPMSQFSSDQRDMNAIATEEKQLISQYGIWLMTGLCKSVDRLSDELLGRLLGMLFQWFHFTSCLPDDQAGSALEKLKGECIKGWIVEVKTKRLDVFISCLLPHPIDCSKVGGHWEVWPDNAHQIKEGFKRLLCLVPYDIITDDIWDEIMPHWMECFRHEVPENELNELKILLSKVFDPELSPLGFETKQMYNFISSRFEDASNTNQEQTLYWLQIITMLEIPIPINFLYQMLRSGVKSLAEIRANELNRLRMVCRLNELNERKDRRMRRRRKSTKQPRDKTAGGGESSRLSDTRLAPEASDSSDGIVDEDDESSCSEEEDVDDIEDDDDDDDLSVTEDDVLLPSGSEQQRGQSVETPRPLTRQERQAQARAAFNAKLQQHTSALDAQQAGGVAGALLSLSASPSISAMGQPTGQATSPTGAQLNLQQPPTESQTSSSLAASATLDATTGHTQPLKSTTGSLSASNQTSSAVTTKREAKSRTRSAKPKLKLNLDSVDNQFGTLNKIDNNLVCYILMMDILLKQLDLQEVSSHHGLDGKEAQAAIALSNEIISTPWLGKHTCCDSLPYTSSGSPTAITSQQQPLVSSGSQNTFSASSMRQTISSAPANQRHTSSSSSSKTTTTTAAAAATAAQQQQQAKQDAAYSNIHSFAHCAQGFEHEDSYETCVFCEIISTFFQLSMSLVEFFSPVIEVSICEVSQDAANGEFDGKPDYSRIGLDHLGPSPKEQNVEFDFSEPAAAATVCPQNQSQQYKFQHQQDPTSPFSPSYFGPTLKPEVLESLPKELQLAYNLLVQFHQYQTPDIVSQLLQMIKLISLHSQVLSKAAKANPQFISWCQHNMLVSKLWSLCQLESSEIARTCVPLLLHCITLPWGVRLFRDLVERDFNSPNWLSRFRAVERVVTIAYFCEPATIKNSTLLQSTMASAFCYVVRCLDDIEAIVAQRALVSLEMMKTSSLKLLLWCLEVQFDYIIIDRSIILRSVFQLYNHLRDRRFLTWEFFLNRFDTIFLEAQIYLQQTGEIPSFTMQDLKNTNTKSEIYQKKIARAKEALQETHLSRSLSARFNVQQQHHNQQDGPVSKPAEDPCEQQYSKQSVALQQKLQAAGGKLGSPAPKVEGLLSATSGGGIGETEASEPSPTAAASQPQKQSPLRRVLQHGRSTSSRYQSVAFLTSQSLAKRKNSKFMSNLALQSVPPLMSSLPDKLHQHLPNSFVDDGSKLNEIAQENHVFGVVHRVCDEDRDTNHSLIFLLMQFFSKPDPSHPQACKTLTRSHQIVLRHLNILMGFSVARKNFLIPASNLRLLPVFNAFLASLPKVLDFNYTLGTILMDTCLPVLIYCPATDNVQFDQIKRPSYSLWLLNPLMRHSWLMSVMTFLYKYQFNQPHLKDQVNMLVWIIINTLESHLNTALAEVVIRAPASHPVSAGSVAPPSSTEHHRSRARAAASTTAAAPKVEQQVVGQPESGQMASELSPVAKPARTRENEEAAESTTDRSNSQTQSPLGVSGSHQHAKAAIYKADTADNLSISSRSKFFQRKDTSGGLSTQTQPEGTKKDRSAALEMTASSSSQAPGTASPPLGPSGSGGGGGATTSFAEQTASVLAHPNEERLLPIGIQQPGSAHARVRQLTTGGSASVERLIPIGLPAPTITAQSQSGSSSQSQDASSLLRKQPTLKSADSISQSSEQATQTLRPLQGLKPNVSLSLMGGSGSGSQSTVQAGALLKSPIAGTKSGIIEEETQAELTKTGTPGGPQLPSGPISSKAARLTGGRFGVGGKHSSSDTRLFQSSGELADLPSSSGKSGNSYSGGGGSSGTGGGRRSKFVNKFQPSREYQPKYPYNGGGGATSYGGSQFSSNGGQQQQQQQKTAGGTLPASSSSSMLSEQLAQVNRHSFVQEFSDRDLSMCLVILETFIHHEPSMAAQMLPNILRLVARYSSASFESWQTGCSNTHLVGGSMFVARQFIRVALHDLMENNIFHQIFTSHFTGYEFYKSMSTALADLEDLNQLIPLSKLFGDLNKQKNLPSLTSLMTILENVATYFECINQDRGSVGSTWKQDPWNEFIQNWENFLRKLILALPRFSGNWSIEQTRSANMIGVSSPAGAVGAGSGSIGPQAASTAAGGTSASGKAEAGVVPGSQVAPGDPQAVSASGLPAGSKAGESGANTEGDAQHQPQPQAAGQNPSSCSMIMTPIMRIILATTKVSNLSTSKTIVDPYSKIISYTVCNSQFKYEHLLEINHNCCRLYTRDREKYLIQRQISYELVQVLKFRFFILEENLLLLLLFILQDVGGTLPTKVLTENLKIDRATLTQADSFVTNVSECLRQHMGDLLEFITDVHAISRINDNLIGGVAAGNSTSGPSSGSASGARPAASSSSINRDSFGGHVKAAISQYLALEISLSNSGDQRTLARYLPWLYNSPSLQQGPREFIDCVSHIRQLSWLILGSLQHSALVRDQQHASPGSGNAVPGHHGAPLVLGPGLGAAAYPGLGQVGSAHSAAQCQPIPIEKNNNIAEHVQVILAGFAEQSKESVLHMSGLFHAFLLCQLWTMYCENICAQHAPNSEQYQYCQSTLDDFWAKITPGILRLVGHSRVMSEMVSTHFLQLIESLIESNSSILIRYLPMWNSVFYSYKRRNKSSNLAIRLQKCIEWQPPDLNEPDIEQNRRRFIQWLEKVQYKMSHIEIQSSQAAPFYLS